jgi:hypothetical protein
VAEPCDVEVGAELAIDPHEQVEIERAGDALRIVVGAPEDVGRLHEVEAHERVIARAELRADVAQEGNRGGTFEVADTRSEEEDEARRGRALGRERPESPRYSAWMGRTCTSGQF